MLRFCKGIRRRRLSPRIAIARCERRFAPRGGRGRNRCRLKWCRLKWGRLIRGRLRRGLIQHRRTSLVRTRLRELWCLRKLRARLIGCLGRLGSLGRRGCGRHHPRIFKALILRRRSLTDCRTNRKRRSRKWTKAWFSARVAHRLHSLAQFVQTKILRIAHQTPFVTTI